MRLHTRDPAQRPKLLSSAMLVPFQEMEKQATHNNVDDEAEAATTRVSYTDLRNLAYPALRNLCASVSFSTVNEKIPNLHRNGRDEDCQSVQEQVRSNCLVVRRLRRVGRCKLSASVPCSTWPPWSVLTEAIPVRVTVMRARVPRGLMQCPTG